MDKKFYTLAAWHVREGQETEFLRLWREELAGAFLNANPSAQGTLIQSLENPLLFYSFGPWNSLEEMQDARSDPQVGQAIGKLLAVCDEATPGPYRLVLMVP